MGLAQSLSALFQKPRVRAFRLHLGLSLVVMAAVLSLVSLAWFPAALFRASGGLNGWLLVAAVDVVLGPLLTLVVFDSAKSRRHLTFDIGVIVAVQLAALAAGLSVVHHARPIAVAHVFDTFHVLRQQDFAAAGVDWAPLATFPGGYPKVVYVPSETNPLAFATQMILDELKHERPAPLRVDQYRALPPDRAQVAKILRQSKQAPPDGCLPQDIASVYAAGSICFHPETQRFTDFEAGASVPWAPMPEEIPAAPPTAAGQAAPER